MAYSNIERDDAAGTELKALAKSSAVFTHNDLKTVAVEANHCLAEVTSNQSRANPGSVTCALGQVGRNRVGGGDVNG